MEEKRKNSLANLSTILPLSDDSDSEVEVPRKKVLKKRQRHLVHSDDDSDDESQPPARKTFSQPQRRISPSTTTPRQFNTADPYTFLSDDNVHGSPGMALRISATDSSQARSPTQASSTSNRKKMKRPAEKVMEEEQEKEDESPVQADASEGKNIRPKSFYTNRSHADPSGAGPRKLNFSDRSRSRSNIQQTSTPIRINSEGASVDSLSCLVPVSLEDQEHNLENSGTELCGTPVTSTQVSATQTPGASQHTECKCGEVLVMVKGCHNMLITLLKAKSREKCTPPQRVVQLVHTAYDVGIRKRPLRWHFGPGKKYTDEDNRPMTVHINLSVRGGHLTATAEEIAVATETYFTSLNKQRDYDKHRLYMKMRSRRVAKAERRKDALKKVWDKYDNPELIKESLEQQYMSDDEDGVKDGKKVFYTRPLLWESEVFREIKAHLDAVSENKVLSDDSKGKMIERIKGDFSTADHPKNIPKKLRWIMKNV